MRAVKGGRRAKLECAQKTNVGVLLPLRVRSLSFCGFGVVLKAKTKLGGRRCQWASSPGAALPPAEGAISALNRFGGFPARGLPSSGGYPSPPDSGAFAPMLRV